MQCNIRGFIFRFFSIFFIVVLLSLPAISQPPTGIPQEINPNQINPQELTQPQLRSLLEDKNRETGKDRNAELNSKLVESPALRNT